MAVSTIDLVFRDYVVDGVPSSGAHKPVKADIRDTLNSELTLDAGEVLTTIRTDTSPLVIVASGQSNMALPEKNLADTAFTTYTPEPNLRVWNNPDFTNAVGAGDTTTTATGTAFITPPSNRLLLSLATANEIAKANPQRTVYVINVGNSGQPITQWLVGAGAPDVYANMKASVEAALAAIGETTVDLLLWWQGESDVANTTYITDFQTFVNRLYAETWFPRETQMMVFSLGSNAQTGQSTHDAFNAGTLKRLVSQETALRTYVDVTWVSNSNWDAFRHARLEGYSKIGRYVADLWAGRSSRTQLQTSGLWTPKLYANGSEAGGVYHANTQGFWSRVGTLVTVSGLVQMTTKPSGAGAVSMSLPFPTNSIATANIVASGYLDTVLAVGAYAAQFQSVLTLVRFVPSSGSIILPTLNDNHIIDTFTARFTITYNAAVDSLGSSTIG